MKRKLLLPNYNSGCIEDDYAENINESFIIIRFNLNSLIISYRNHDVTWINRYRINYGVRICRVINTDTECWNVCTWHNVYIILATRLITAGDLRANKLTINVTQSRLEILNRSTFPITRYLFHDRAQSSFYTFRAITPIQYGT